MKDLTPPGASYVSSRGNGTWPFFFFVTNFVLMPIFFKLASEEMSASTARSILAAKFRTLNLNHRPLLCAVRHGTGIRLNRSTTRVPIHMHASGLYSRDIARPYACIYMRSHRICR